MSNRFASPELLRLGQPPKLASRDFESIHQQSLADMVARFSAAGIPFNVEMIEGDPAIAIKRTGDYRDMMRRQEIDNAVAQTYLGHATGEMLDQRAADYGVVRAFIAYTGSSSDTPVRPATIPDTWFWDGAVRGWREDDSSLRMRAGLAWEALSVAGPAGAYLFHAASAHPLVSLEGTAVYGPETGHVEPGEVLLVIQTSVGDGVPSISVLEAVAAPLDAYEVKDRHGAITTNVVRRQQSVRPLGAKVLIHAAKLKPYHIEATIYVHPGPDPEITRAKARERLELYLKSRRRVGVEVPLSAVVASLHLTSPDGLPIVEEVKVAHPLADVVPAHNEIASPTSILVNVEVL